MATKNDMGSSSIVLNLIDGAEKTGAGFMLFDGMDRVVYSNGTNNGLFFFIDFELNPTYEESFRACLEHNRFVERDAYSEPDRWLASAMDFRRLHRFAQFVKEYPDGRLFMVTHEIVPGVGSYYARAEVTSRVRKAAAGDGLLFGPGSWNGFVESAPYAVRTSLAGMPTAGAIVSSNGVVVECNDAMSAMLQEGDGLRLVGDRLVAWLPAEKADLWAALAGVTAHPGTGQGSGEVLLKVSRERNGQPLLVKVTRCNGPVNLPALCMVVVFDPDQRAAVPASVMGRLYGLTDAEARIAVAVGMGDELQSIAERSGTSYQTVRTQMKSILGKVGVNRQSELVRLFSRLAAIFKPSVKT